jgi:hypothetical protein
MKRPGKPKQVIAAALTWDGVRLPVRSLPPKARAFLRGKSDDATLPSAKKTAELFSDEAIRELRICWVPQLRGGEAVLNEVLPAPGGKRIAFRTIKTIRFGDILGVVYRR